MQKFCLTIIILPLFFIMACNDQGLDPERQMDIAVRQVDQAIEHLDDTSKMPRSIPLDKKHWETVDIYDWTSGFWPGILWYVYEYTGEDKWLEEAARFTSALEPVKKMEHKNHDLGFMIYNSYGNGYRLTGDPEYRSVMLETADSLVQLFNANAGTILSWPWAVHQLNWPHNTIIDNMMNLELLFWAAENGRPGYYDLAVQHARTTQQYHIRPDYSTYHVVVFDDQTGEMLQQVTRQGYSDSSMWARGQAWGIYGFTMTYRETGEKEFLNTAMNMANAFIERLPKDHVPYWDFDAPGIPAEEKDASAAAIAASALIELSGLVGDEEEGDYYKREAVAILTSLSSPAYQAEGINDAILMHSVGGKPQGSEIDVSLIYADYYYIEALLRLLQD